MTPKIGISTKIFSPRNWFDELDTQKYKVIEIYRRQTRLPFDPWWLKKYNIKELLKGYDVSLHSATKSIFTGVDQFTITELHTLKSEIILCEMLDIKELIFHLKGEKLTESEEQQLREIINFAKQHNVQMIYECNSVAHAEVMLDILNRFPDIGFNLDIGHINKSAYHKKLGCEIGEFVKKVKDRIIYLHAHNNFGEHDNHNALSDGTLNWKHIFDQLDFSKIRKIIIETTKKENIAKSQQDLDLYFNSRQQ